MLDPACGSGNFLYVALKRLLDLEKEVSLFAAQHARLSGLLPQVQPGQLYGIEVNTYAHELASVVVWIGYIQWLHENGFGIPDKPILKPLDNIRRTDASSRTGRGSRSSRPGRRRTSSSAIRPSWGASGCCQNLGDRVCRTGCAGTLFRPRAGRKPTWCAYWFERARALIADGQVQRAGLLATQAIRGGANRRVLEGIKATGDIFMAWSDRKWVLDGAAVRVSMVGFDAGAETAYTLDSEPVKTINANLTSALDLTQAQRLLENNEPQPSWVTLKKAARSKFPTKLAQEMLAAPLNPNGRPNSDVVRPWVNGMDITRRPRGMWIIDFGVDMPEEQAALYERPICSMCGSTLVKPARDGLEQCGRPRSATDGGLHERAYDRICARRFASSLDRFIGTHRVLQSTVSLCGCQPRTHTRWSQRSNCIRAGR